MRSFQAGGTTWHVEITTLEVMRIRSQGIDLRKCYRGEWQQLGELIDDPSTFAPMLWLIVEEQAKKIGVTMDAFYSLLAGDQLAAAQDAFTRSLFDFFPDPRARAVAHQAMDEAQKARSSPIPSTLPTTSQELQASTLGDTP